jgi:hypothetical protein
VKGCVCVMAHPEKENLSIEIVHATYRVSGM